MDSEYTKTVVDKVTEHPYIFGGLVIIIILVLLIIFDPLGWGKKRRSKKKRSKSDEVDELIKEIHKKQDD